jgi:outer membrane protein assembly factor BamB
MPDAVLGPIAVRDGKAVCPVRNGEVVALDLKTGGEPRILWRQRVSGRSPVLAGPGFTGGLVYAVSQDGYMAVLDAADGKVLEKHYINAEGRPGELGLTVSSPAVVGGRVYVGSETGGVWCFVGQESR